MNDFHEYLTEIECKFHNAPMNQYYLWPATPIGGTHQKIITQRVGAGDEEIANRHSRTFLILRLLKQLQVKNLLPPDFSLIDIACGDALVIGVLHRYFPQAWISGVDCYKGHFESHAALEQEGVHLYGGFLQHLFTSRPPHPFSVTLMLNTYQGWENANLREHEKMLPEQANEWMKHDSIFSIVTATGKQLKQLSKEFQFVAVLGAGEDNSYMCCLSQQSIPIPWWSYRCKIQSQLTFAIRKIKRSNRLRKLLGLKPC